MCSLLLADDDVQQLAIRKLLLEASGHEVAVAETAAQAGSLAAQLRPDAILMDLCLPKLKDGLGLIREVARQGMSSRLIVLSGWIEELLDLPEERLVACALGKPFSHERLLEAIETVAPSADRNVTSGSS